MGVFGKIFKHPSQEQGAKVDASSQQADPLQDLGPLPTDSQGTDPLADMPPLPTDTKQEIPDLGAQDIPMTADAPVAAPATDNTASTSSSTTSPEVSLHDPMQMPHEYELGPEPVIQHHEPTQNNTKELPSFDNGAQTQQPQQQTPLASTSQPEQQPEKAVHMGGKIHVPTPSEDDLIVKEVYVERDHFIELLSALHIARHDIEHGLSGRVTLEQTNSQLQNHLDNLQGSLEKIQKHTMQIETVIAQHQK